MAKGLCYFNGVPRESFNLMLGGFISCQEVFFPPSSILLGENKYFLGPASVMCFLADR